MDMDDNKDLRKHLDEFAQQEAEEGEGPMEGEILFSPGHTFFRPPLFSRALVTQDLHTPNLQHIFWAVIQILLPPSPTNATDAMFDTLDEFVTKMQEANQRFLIFPTTSHNMDHLSPYPKSLTTQNLFQQMLTIGWSTSHKQNQGFRAVMCIPQHLSVPVSHSAKS